MHLPKSTKNLLTIAGALIAIISLVIIVLLFLISTYYDANNSFLGIFIYMALPALMAFGLILIPIGMIRAKRQEKRKIEGAPEYPFGISTNRRHAMQQQSFLWEQFVWQYYHQ